MWDPFKGTFKGPYIYLYIYIYIYICIYICRLLVSARLSRFHTNSGSAAAAMPP